MLTWLWVLLSFKLGDSLGSPMIKPMLVDAGWTLPDIGSLTFLTTLAGIGGALLGGALYAPLGPYRALLWFGVLQALGLAGWGLVALDAGDPIRVYTVALFEQIADGMSTVALFAMMMNQCRLEHEGADYSVQACAQLILAGLIGALSGLSAHRLGYSLHFLLAALLGLVALVWVVRYFRLPVVTSSSTA